MHPYLCAHPQLPISDQLTSVTLKLGQSQILIFAAFNSNQICYNTNRYIDPDKGFLAYVHRIF